MGSETVCCEGGRNQELPGKREPMIPRTLVPVGARLPAEDVATTRRRPTTLDERTLVPSGMPLVQLDGRTTIPSHLPLDSIATRVVVPRDVNMEAVQREEVSHLP